MQGRAPVIPRKKMKIGFKVGVIRGARSRGQLSDTGGKRVN
jgi:hypothetical protein